MDTRTYSRDELEEAAGLAAGATSGAFLRMHPGEVMPPDVVSEAVDLALAAFDERRLGMDGEAAVGAEDYCASQLRGLALNPDLNDSELYALQSVAEMLSVRVAARTSQVAV